jgi:polyphosphate kinase
MNCLENRELSWLRFNERVLEEAEDERVPLCERLSFLSIFQSNLDEFFMVRIGSLHDQMLLDKESRENKTRMTPGEQIEACISRIRELCHRRDRTYAALLERLHEQGISIVNFREISQESSDYLREMFRREFLPLMATYIVGKKQSFPFLKNKDIYAVAVLGTKGDKKAEKQKIGIVPCGTGVFPRLIAIPERTGCFMLAEELILHFLPEMFPGYKVVSKTLARITRSADIDADAVYDEDLNYRDHMAEVVKLRQKLLGMRSSFLGIEISSLKMHTDKILSTVALGFPNAFDRPIKALKCIRRQSGHNTGYTAFKIGSRHFFHKLGVSGIEVSSRPAVCMYVDKSGDEHRTVKIHSFVHFSKQLSFDRRLTRAQRLNGIARSENPTRLEHSFTAIYSRVFI